MLERILVGPMYTNCYILSNGKKECIIIDPGGNSDEIVSRVNMLKMIPVAIILTHGHFDHTAACGALEKIYLEKEIDLQIAIHSKDKNYLGKSGIKKNMETLVDLGLDPDEDGDKLFADLPQPTILLMESIHDKIMTLPPETRVFPGHGVPTSIEREQKGNPFLR